MIIAIDFDDTYTQDPELWLGFIEQAQARGHRVICATMRTRAEGENIDQRLKDAVEIVYTYRMAKQRILQNKGIFPNVWIDDSPMWILHDARMEGG